MFRGAVLLLAVIFVPPLRAEEAADALQNTAALLQASAAKYSEQRECFSCHHQTLALLGAIEVRRAGLEIDAPAAEAQREFTLKYLAGRREKLLKGEGVPGGAYSAGYALWQLELQSQPADETTAALLTYLQKTQQPDGRWRILDGSHRPPLEESDVTATALAIRALAQWQAAPEQDVQPDLARAAAWLRETKPKTTEDYVFRLLGWHWLPKETDGRQTALDSAAKALRDLQRPDGGWGQIPDMASDAYATGQAVYTLQSSPGDQQPAIARGVAWLNVARQADGSWLVETRAKPFQDYFESGFPHGKSQFISTAATGWAVAALARDHAARKKPAGE